MSLPPLLVDSCGQQLRSAVKLYAIKNSVNCIIWRHQRFGNTKMRSEYFKNEENYHELQDLNESPSQNRKIRNEFKHDKK